MKLFGIFNVFLLYGYADHDKFHSMPFNLLELDNRSYKVNYANVKEKIQNAVYRFYKEQLDAMSALIPWEWAFPEN